jgi:hypothetical protein
MNKKSSEIIELKTSSIIDQILNEIKIAQGTTITKNLVCT